MNRVQFGHFKLIGECVLLFISAVIESDRTALASFKIRGTIPSRPVAFAGFSPFINSET